MKRIISIFSFVIFTLISNQALAFEANETSFSFQVGAFRADEGESATVPITNVGTANFTLDSKHDTDWLVGLGYRFNDFQQTGGAFALNYWLVGYYLSDTKISGLILSPSPLADSTYHYSLNHLPIFAMAKAQFGTEYNQMAITIDGGLGPNIIRTSGFRSSPINGNPSLINDAYSGYTTLTGAATAGIGLKFAPIFGQIPIECGYRFFYLGEGKLKRNTSLVEKLLKTGTVTAHALICSFEF